MKNQDSYFQLSQMSKEEILKLYETNESGLSDAEVYRRLEEYGKNIPNDTKEKSAFLFLLESFKDKFILILFVLAIVNYITGDMIGSFIIIGISVISALIRFVQDYSTYRFNLRLKE